jgi:hypothetical protein
MAYAKSTIEEASSRRFTTGNESETGPSTAGRPAGTGFVHEKLPPTSREGCRRVESRQDSATREPLRGRMIGIQPVELGISVLLELLHS